MTTYRKLTPSKAFKIAKEAQKNDFKFWLDEDKDGLIVEVQDNKDGYMK